MRYNCTKIMNTNSNQVLTHKHHYPFLSTQAQSNTALDSPQQNTDIPHSSS